MVFNMNTFIEGLMNTQIFDGKKEKNEIRSKKDMLEYILYEAGTQREVENIKEKTYLDLLENMEDYLCYGGCSIVKIRIMERAESVQEIKQCRLL